MEIEKMKLTDLKPAAYNPRVSLEPGMDEYEKLKRSIEEFGFIDPPVFNKQTGNLVGGHQRISVAKNLGYTEIEVSIVDIDIEKEKELNIALNKVSGLWDENKLALLLKDFSDDQLSLAGFDKEEASDIISKFDYNLDIETPIEDDDFDVQEALDKIREPVTKSGDVWKLGNHFLMCGDATKQEDIEKLMCGHKANLVITDPPYNVAVESSSKELQESGRGEILNDNMSDDEFDEFLDLVFKNYSTIMNNDSAIYVFHGSSYQREFENAMNAHDIVVRSQCIWVKNNATFGWSQYRWQHEPCFYAHKKKQAPFWQGDRKQSTVWRSNLLDDEPSTIWEIKTDDVTKYYHPTQKPLDLIAIPMRNSSNKGDRVVDLFGGSGSTLMTCEKLGRICHSLELDPIFCDVIIQRFEKDTGIKAVKMN